MTFNINQWAGRWLDSKCDDIEAIEQLKIFYKSAKESGHSEKDVHEAIHRVSVERRSKK